MVSVLLVSFKVRSKEKMGCKYKLKWRLWKYKYPFSWFFGATTLIIKTVVIMPFRKNMINITTLLLAAISRMTFEFQHNIFQHNNTQHINIQNYNTQQYSSLQLSNMTTFSIITLNSVKHYSTWHNSFQRYNTQYNKIHLINI